MMRQGDLTVKIIIGILKIRRLKIPEKNKEMCVGVVIDFTKIFQKIIQ